MIPIGEKLITVFNEQFQSDDESWEKKGNFLMGMYDRANEHDKAIMSNVIMALCGWEYDSLMQLTNGTAVAPTLSVEEDTTVHDNGYTWEGMTKISPSEALERFNNGEEVFVLYDDDSEGAITEVTQIKLGGSYGHE